jgi:transposase InsO family protein
MSLPRQVLPGEYYMITRRCSERRFLLRPDRATNNAYLYCLIEAALRFRSQAEARMAVFDYLEGFYNPRRRHSALGRASPIEYERTQFLAA